MRVTQTQTNFWGGQIATQSQGFADDELYKASASEITNFVVTPNGGLTRRPGTKFVARTKANATAQSHNGNAVKLIPFSLGHSSTQNFVLEFGHVSGSGYIRFYKDGAQVLDSGSAYEVGSSPFNTDTKIKNMNYAQSAAYLFLVSPDVPPQQLQYTNDTSWALSAISFLMVLISQLKKKLMGIRLQQLFLFNQQHPLYLVQLEN